MKPVIAWIRKNVVAVICAALAVIVLPTSIVLSAGWTSKVREEAQKRASDELKKVEANKVSYTLPAVLPGVTAASFSAEPNAKITEHLKARREQLLKEAGTISGKAEEINRRTPLIEGFFPKSATPEEQQSKGLEFADILVGGPGRPSAYQKLFDKARAGNPPPADRVGVQLRDERERAEDILKAGQKDRVLTSSEILDIQKRLVDLRQSEYRKRAAELSVYGSPDVLIPADDFPKQVPAQPPTPFQAFRWQWDLWLVTDVMEAISRANGLDKGRVGIEGSVVKRINAISVRDSQSNKLRGETAESGQSGGQRDDRGGGPGGPPPADPNAIKALVPPNFTASVTGRYNAGSNQVYSVRSPTVDLIVSSARLPELFDAFASVNFMTIDGDMHIYAVDPWKELEEGYYYGEEPVVRVTFRVESIYLRSWLAPLMPEQTRRVLGVAYAEPKTDDKAGGKPGEDGRRGDGEGRRREGEGRPPEGEPGRGGRPDETGRSRDGG